MTGRRPGRAHLRHAVVLADRRSRPRREGLVGLGERLALPEGWSFSSRVLDERLELWTEASDGTASVINDDLLNSDERSS